MSYAETIQFLHGLGLFGANLGLANTRRLAAQAGDPHERLRFIHVAGTNGKGSVCAMLESICRHAGLRVGMFTSPHLVRFGERIQVNRQLLPEEATARLLERLMPALQSFPETQHPTFFEVVTVMALMHFAEQACDVVVWETGMGGRLDATNIVSPLCSAITNVGADHQRWLGQSLTEIAREKAGIIKPGVPVVSAAQEPDARRVIAEAARRNGAPLTWVEGRDLFAPPLDTLQLPLSGTHQRWNAAVALGVARALQPELSIPEEAVHRGLETFEWPGRFQLARLPGGQEVMLDGAHNVPGAVALLHALVERFPGRDFVFILGVLEDKDGPGLCRALAPRARRVCLTPVQSSRSACPDALLPAWREIGPGVEVSAHTCLADALACTSDEPLRVVTGSIYLVGEAMELLGLSSARPLDEKGLNDWAPSRAMRAV